MKKERYSCKYGYFGVMIRLDRSINITVVLFHTERVIFYNLNKIREPFYSLVAHKKSSCTNKRNITDVGVLSGTNQDKNKFRFIVFQEES